MKKQAIIAIAALTITLCATAKKMLSHGDFDGWKSARNISLSNDGRWAAYSVQPQEGNGMLSLKDTRSNKVIEIERGYNPKFTADSQWVIALIKPLYSDTRQGKIDKKKGFELPQDSLAIVNLKNGKVTKTPNVTGFKIGKDGGEWLAYVSVDTLYIKKKELKDKKAGKPLIVRNLFTGKENVIKNVKDYSLSKDGMNLAFTLKKSEKDSLSTDGVGIMKFPDTSYVLIDRDQKFYGVPVFDETGRKLAYTASMDTLESGTLHAELYLANLNNPLIEPKLIQTKRTENVPINLAPAHSSDSSLNVELEAQRSESLKNMAGRMLYANQYSKPVFSHNGKRLVIGIAPEISPDDTTIVDFEQAALDIWRWDAPMTPPQEIKAADRLKKHTFPLVINLENGGMDQLLTSNPLANVVGLNRWDADWAMIIDPSNEVVSRQWDYLAPEDVYVINVDNGNSRKAFTAMKECTEVSPAGKYIIFYDKDRNYRLYDIASDKVLELTSRLPVTIWEDSEDYPMMQTPYGIAGWTDDDKEVLIYDKYDIWSIDPTGKSKPVNLTAGDGRKNNRRYRYIKTDPEQRSIKNGDKMLLSVFDYNDKRNGLATVTAGKSAAPALKVLDTYQFNQIRKAKDAPIYTFTKGNFSTIPDIWLAKGEEFKNGIKLTDVNSQKNDFYWGEAQLVKWTAYDGRECEGVLYIPENFDTSHKYPMISYFYEKNSEQLYRHYVMEPSWSWINFPFYTSRGYVIFVPDVHYTPGIPGEGAYNCIVSGIEALCQKYPWIDKDKIGIDGQSWGGYQTAYLITRTNMFACAGSGAPVANMTSAFGGIRWGTGDSRQVQYEMGQSRIGRNLWEAPELYIANSPLFRLDKVNTPLLIMHNDADGAVPWYQGIELFMGLRRLQKPVWMLQYNGEGHNLKERKNCKDITIRFQQFFDHILKDAPMPEWMKYGVPITRKGQEMGTGLVEDK
ncbi:MAG: prolyl oligopeptidase family serine peptidase [Prevotella sp.]|nr:prolyl oligopeptidase family serine peptidase [Bacteroides sp.]MCM1366291.1 prolyl oligopeptidase family serine peptidase [Prevotella sp.]MCM1437095.1 prolyl oligopeptidase family serine peptidase [Prevotella sp.]